MALLPDGLPAVAGLYRHHQRRHDNPGGQPRLAAEGEVPHGAVHPHPGGHGFGEPGLLPGGLWGDAGGVPGAP